MQSAATSSPNTAPTTEMWKFGGTTSSMCRTCGSKSNVKFLHVKAKPIWLHCFCSCFFHLLSLSFCRPCTVQNTHGGCDILDIQSRSSQKGFSPGFVHPAMFNPRHSASMPNVLLSCSGHTSWSVSLPLVRLMSYDSNVNCVFDPLKLHSMRIHRIAAMNGIHPAQSRNAWALSLARDEMLPEGSNRLESSRLFLEPNWENCEWLTLLWPPGELRAIVGFSSYMLKFEFEHSLAKFTYKLRSNDHPKTCGFSFFRANATTSARGTQGPFCRFCSKRVFWFLD